MGEVHPDRRGLVQHREAAVRGPLGELGPDAKRVVRRVADSKHPLVAANRANAQADLLGKGLEGGPFVGFGETAGDGVACALAGLLLEKDSDGLFESALEQMIVSLVGHAGAVGQAFADGNVIAMDRVEKEQGADALV